MTPKNKAKELMGRFNYDHNSELKEYIIYQSLEESKRCSLIAVDEIIKSHTYGLSTELKTYWYDVKKEIENL